MGAASVTPLARWSRSDDEVASLSAALAGRAGVGPNARIIGVSVVGAPEREALLVDHLRSSGYEVLVRPDAGLAMEIRHPETCGSDRQYAVRAALEDRLHGITTGSIAGSTGGDGVQVLVIDAGTAVTVDAGIVRHGTESGAAPVMSFMGGAIALGPGSLASAITARGARLAEFEPDPAAPALGRSTVEALQAGVSVGFRGAVRELCQGVQRGAFGNSTSVGTYLTGGARAFARVAVAETCSDGFHENAELVHLGIAHAVRAAVLER